MDHLVSVYERAWCLDVCGKIDGKLDTCKAKPHERELHNYDDELHLNAAGFLFLHSLFEAAKILIELGKTD